MKVYKCEGCGTMMFVPREQARSGVFLRCRACGNTPLVEVECQEWECRKCAGRTRCRASLPPDAVPRGCTQSKHLNCDWYRVQDKEPEWSRGRRAWEEVTLAEESGQFSNGWITWGEDGVRRFFKDAECPFCKEKDGEIERLRSLSIGLVKDRQGAIKSQRKVQKQREQQKARAKTFEAEIEILFAAIAERFDVEDWTNPAAGLTELEAHCNALG